MREKIVTKYPGQEAKEKRISVKPITQCSSVHHTPATPHPWDQPCTSVVFKYCKLRNKEIKENTKICAMTYTYKEERERGMEGGEKQRTI